MIIRKETQKLETKPHLREGKGQVEFRELLTKEQFCGHGRLFSVLTLEPGSSIGWHVHEGESETYYILHGTAQFNDNNEQTVTVNAGDCTYTPSGQGHGIENIGDEPLKFVALIVYD